MSMLEALKAAGETPAGRDLELTLAIVEEAIRRETGSEEPFVADMARHVTLAGGKRIRPRLLLLAHRACGGEGLEDVVEAATAIELIHTASLVHDDIIDHADVRRGRWTLHRKHGLGQALVAGDYLFTRGFFLAGCLDEEAVRIFTDSCTALCEGEVLEQQWLGRRDLSEETYMEIIRKKTAEVVRSTCMVGAHLAGASRDVVEAMGDYGLAVGMAFQVWDDVLDLVGDADKLGKPGGVDLDRGVLTLPLILHRDAGGKLPRWPTKRRVLRALEATGAMEETRTRAHAYADEAVEHLEGLPEGVHKMMLQGLAKVVVSRDH